MIREGTAPRFLIPALLFAACAEGQGLDTSGAEIVGLPNIRLSSITRGDLDHYDVEVCNTGTAVAESFGLSVYSVSIDYGFSHSYEDWIANIAPASCQTMSVPCWAVGSGDCNDAGGLVADADPHGMVIETSEVDNTLEVRFGSLENIASHQISRTNDGYIVDVCNEGEGNLDWFEVQLHTDSDLYGFFQSYSLGVVHLPAGNCQEESVPCWAVGDGSCADPVNVIVSLDPYQMVRESDEADNLREEAFTSARDLEAGAITRALDEYRLEVCNRGAATTEQSDISLYSISATSGTYVAYSLGIPSLEAGACYQESVPCWTFGDGSCSDEVRVLMDVDPWGVVRESNETNNLSESSFTTLRNLSPGSITRDANGYLAEVCNTGLAASEWSDVRVYQSSATFGFYASYSFGAPFLEAGACHQELVPCSAIGDGSCTDQVSAVLEVDSSEILQETHESDNFAETAFAGAGSSGLPDHRVASLARSPSTGYELEICNDGTTLHPSGLLLDIQQKLPFQWELESGGAYGVPPILPGTCELILLPCGIVGMGTCEEVVTVRANLINGDGPNVVDDVPQNDAVLLSFDDRPEYRLEEIRRIPTDLYEFEICNDGTTWDFEGVLLELFEKQPLPQQLEDRGAYYVPPVAPGTCEMYPLPCGALGMGSCEEVLTVRAALRSTYSDKPLDSNPANDARTVVYTDRPDHRLASVSRSPGSEYLFEICNDGTMFNHEGALLELYERRPGQFDFDPRGAYYVPSVDPMTCTSYPVPCGALGDGNCEEVITIRARLKGNLWELPLDNDRFNDFAIVSYLDRPDHRLAAIRRAPMTGYEVDVCNDGTSINPMGMTLELYERNDQQPNFSYRNGLGVPLVAPQSCETIQFPCGFLGDGTCEDVVLVRANLNHNDPAQPLDNNDTNDFAYAPFGLPDSPRVAAQVGLLVAKQNSKTSWGTVTLGHQFENPVVVFNAISSIDNAPAHGRVKNALAGSFQWQIEEWDYLDGKHGTESLPWLVVESGRHNLADAQASALEAGKVNATHVWTTVTFSEPFPVTPVVSTGVMSDNDPRAVVARVRNVTTTGFEVRVQEAEADNGTHVAELVGWVALVPGVRDVAGMAFEANSLTNSVTHQFFPMYFSTPFSAPPIVLASLTSFNGSEPAGVRIKGPDAGGQLSVKVEEERSKDYEMNHEAETVSWFAFGEPGLLYDR
jgi:hypothetical protein